jgi:hypothetical protein
LHWIPPRITVFSTLMAPLASWRFTSAIYNGSYILQALKQSHPELATVAGLLRKHLSMRNAVVKSTQQERVVP